MHTLVLVNWRRLLRRRLVKVLLLTLRMLVLVFMLRDATV
jgi:hypothetical protein